MRPGMPSPSSNPAPATVVIWPSVPTRRTPTNSSARYRAPSGATATSFSQRNAMAVAGPSSKGDSAVVLPVPATVVMIPSGPMRRTVAPALSAT